VKEHLHFLDGSLRNYKTATMQVRKCYFCDYRIPIKSKEERHLRSHTKETPFFCRQKNCRAMFTRKESLVKHRKKKHNIWNAQKRLTTKTNYECYFCSNKIRSYSFMVSHLSIHTLERPFKCPFTKCAKYYHTKTHQRNHSVVCDYNPGVKINLAKRKEKHTQILDQCRFQCYFCRKNFTSISTLFPHIRSIHLSEQYKKCVGCKRDIKYRDINEHVKNCADIGKLFVCKFCHISKISMARLNYHIQSVHTKDAMKSKCYFCNREIETDQIGRHLASHTKERLHKCRHCKKYFVSGHNLQTHFGLRHVDTKEGAVISRKLKRKCYFCQKHFSNRWNLRNHMFVHTQETK